MATKKKLAPSSRSGGDRYGIPGLDMNQISKLTSMDGLSDESDDGDMEAELEAIMSGKTSAGRKKRKEREPVNMNNIQSMVDECMQSDESDGNGGNLSGDEDLLAELNKVISRSPPPGKSMRPAPPIPAQMVRNRSSESRDDSQTSTVVTMDILQGRLSNYKEAEYSAKSVGDLSKARRYGRAVKTLETLIREFSSGSEVNPDDIPPAVAIRKEPPTVEPQPEPTLPKSSTPSSPARADPQSVAPQSVEQPIPNRRISLKEVKTESKHNMLTTRRDQYKVAALNAKKAGDSSTAIKYVRIAKQFDIVIQALENGQPIDLSKMPPPPPREALRQNSVGSQEQKASTVIQSPTVPVSSPQEQVETNLENSESNEEDAKKYFNAPAPPSTVLEALEQRLEKYQSTQKAAVAESNTSKAKRLGRIVKQYEDAIKNYKAGKPVDFQALPSPPGFGEIPGTANAASAQGPAPPVPPHKPAAAHPTAPAKTTDVPQSKANPQRPALVPQQSVKSGRSPTSLLEKQIHFLSERQKLFREAALEAKKNGDIEQAKEYLRMSKGIEPMIEATRSGLPIDATTIPTPPQLKEDFVILDKSEGLDDDWVGDKQEMFRTLERDLTKQIDICMKNRNHFLKLGDVSAADKFETLCKHTKQDLTVIQNLWQKGETLPKFHYENRVFTIVQCHSELGDNEIEVEVVRGINLPGKPNDLDSYVKVEFPFPSETPQFAKTHTVKDTNAPEYKTSFKFEINRKSRALSRVFKRHNMKLEVWSKGGLFRSDTLLGTALVKLCDFDTKCTIHDSFDLMTGRKACGGKIEAKACIRDPLLAKQVEEVRERWLVIGS